jgi:hypothetical protein
MSVEPSDCKVFTAKFYAESNRLQLLTLGWQRIDQKFDAATSNAKARSYQQKQIRCQRNKFRNAQKSRARILQRIPQKFS